MKVRKSDKVCHESHRMSSVESSSSESKSKMPGKTSAFSYDFEFNAKRGKHAEKSQSRNYARLYDQRYKIIRQQVEDRYDERIKKIEDTMGKTAAKVMKDKKTALLQQLIDYHNSMFERISSVRDEATSKQIQAEYEGSMTELLQKDGWHAGMTHGMLSSMEEPPEPGKHAPPTPNPTPGTDPDHPPTQVNTPPPPTRPPPSPAPSPSPAPTPVPPTLPPTHQSPQGPERPPRGTPAGYPLDPPPEKSAMYEYPDRTRELQMKRYFVKALEKSETFKGVTLNANEVNRLFNIFKSSGSTEQDTTSVINGSSIDERVSTLTGIIDSSNSPLQASLSKEWDENGMKTQYAQSRGIPLNEVNNSGYQTADNVRSNASAQGFDPKTGQQTRGVITNAGGGIIDTDVGTDEIGDDVITSGPQSVKTATKTLRQRYPEASAQDVQVIQGGGDSATLFEAFSWVPEGFGLGPSNRLHRLNVQHDNLRFGMEQLDQPRKEEPLAHPHPIPYQFSDTLELRDIGREFLKTVNSFNSAIDVHDTVLQNGSTTLQGDIMRMPSTQGLDRRKTTPFEPVINNISPFLPWKDPTGIEMNRLPMMNANKATCRKRKLSLYNVEF